MGVLNCSMKDCEEILCRTYINEVGYICDDCKSRFNEYLLKNGLKPKSEEDYIEYLKVFKKTSKDNISNIEDFFNKFTFKN